MAPLSISPDLLAAVLAGKDPNAPDPNAPKPAAPVVDPKYGKPSLAAQPKTSAASSTPVADPDAGNTQATITPPSVQPTKDMTYTGSGYQPTFIRQASTALPPPTFNTDARAQAMKTLATPAPTHDQYKPSVLRQIMGSLSAGLLGYAHNPNAIDVGIGAINAPFNRAMSSWQTQQGQAKELLGEENKDYEAETKNYQNALSNTMRGEQLDEKYANLERLTNRDNRIADLTQQLRDTQQQNADNRNPVEKFKATQAQRRAEIAEFNKDPKTRLTPDEQKYYLANGKLKEGDPYADQKMKLMQERIDLMSDHNDIMREKAENAGPKHVKDRQSFEQHWGQRFQSEAEKPYNAARAAVLKQYGADKSESAYKDNKDAIESALAPYEAQREAKKAELQAEKDAEAEQYNVYNQGKPVPDSQRVNTPQSPTLQSGKRTPAQIQTKNLKPVGQSATVVMTGPKGKFNVPANKVSVFQQNGYSVVK